jgi:hypothetical protein
MTMLSKAELDSRSVWRTGDEITSSRSTSPADATRPHSVSGIRQAVVVAVILTVANAVKPLHIDDPAYYHNAEHLARRPLDPYGFNIFWYEYPEPANAVLAPPVLLYWWSLAIRLFGQQVFLWKLWLLPFCLAFTFALLSLFKRFAPGMEGPLLWLAVLSPTFLPSLNLMPDVPALALALAALGLFLYAVDRNSYRLAIVAGLFAALSMQTKYTAFTAPVVMLAASLFHRRPGLGALALLTAGLTFTAWETFVSYQQGASHFVVALSLGDPIRRIYSAGLTIPLTTCVGGVASALGLLALVALEVRCWLVLPSVAVVIGAYVGMALGIWHKPEPVFLGLGCFVWSVMALVIWRLIRRSNQTDWLLGPAFFLVVWLAIELVAYYTISPFPAVRRVMGIVVVLTILTGRLTAGTIMARSRRWLIWLVVAIGVALGSGFAALDWWEARVRQLAAIEAGERIHRYDPEHRPIWFTGHWGFQYYAERAGMMPLVADESPLRAGDWVVLTLTGQDKQMVWVPESRFDQIWRLTPQDSIPLSARGIYTGGGSPLIPQEGPRVDIGIGRIRTDCFAASALPPELVVRWAAERKWPVPRAAIASINRASAQLAERPETSQAAVPALRRLANGPEPALREAAARALARIEAAGPSQH